MKYVLDSSFVLDFTSMEPDADSKFDQLQRNSQEVLFPAPAVYEVLAGLTRSTKAYARSLLAILLAEADIPPFGFVEAVDAALLQDRLSMVGRPLKPVRAMVAAVAEREDATLVTRNGKLLAACAVAGIATETY
ncbi:MAG TPA: type II toxin-antitoxin system VapC family toxin [Thermoplasmata archaeon]|nr:type II toxin-antitoxin system VapC family toxin [Thermoplasmata archaeon]